MRFTHALTHEVACASLPTRSRLALHARIAAMPEERSSGFAERHAEVPAEHHERAGQGAAAVPYWRRAARSASERSANVEAIAHARRGLEIPGALGAQDGPAPALALERLEIELTLAPALVAVRGYGANQVRALYDRARALSLASGDDERLFRAQIGLWNYQWVRGELTAARGVAGDLHALALSREPRLPFWEGTALVNLGWARAIEDEPGAGAELVAEGIALFAGTGARVKATAWQGTLAETIARAGRPDAAAAALDCAFEAADRTWQRYYLPELVRLRGRVMLHGGDVEGGARSLRDAVAVAADQGTIVRRIRAICDLAEIDAHRGEAMTLLAPLRPWLAAAPPAPDVRRARGLLAWPAARHGASRLPSGPVILPSGQRQDTGPDRARHRPRCRRGRIPPGGAIRAPGSDDGCRRQPAIGLAGPQTETFIWRTRISRFWLNVGMNSLISDRLANDFGQAAWTVIDADADASDLAAEQWSAVADFTFTRFNNRNIDSDWVANKVDAAGFPRAVNEDRNVASVYNVDRTLWNDDALQIGGRGSQLPLHEMGHGLGMPHPHGGTTFPGVSSDDDPGTFALNETRFTITSYNQQHRNAVLERGRSGAPLAFDIAAIQVMYRASTDRDPRDDVYRLEEDGYRLSIRDTGGTDRIEYGGDEDVQIDLRSASLDDGPRAGGYLSMATTGTASGGFTIAGDHTDALEDVGGGTGVIIENARGGGRDDILTGNDVADDLQANAGRDVIRGADGDDTLCGGDDDDVMWGDAGDDYLNDGGGGDTIHGGEGEATSSAASGTIPSPGARAPTPSGKGAASTRPTTPIRTPTGQSTSR